MKRGKCIDVVRDKKKKIVIYIVSIRNEGVVSYTRDEIREVVRSGELMISNISINAEGVIRTYLDKLPKLEDLKQPNWEDFLEKLEASLGNARVKREIGNHGEENMTEEEENEKIPVNEICVEEIAYDDIELNKAYYWLDGNFKDKLRRGIERFVKRYNVENDTNIVIRITNSKSCYFKSRDDLLDIY